MKATLEFNLPEEEPEMRDAMNGTLWRGVVMALFNEIRLNQKSGKDSIGNNGLRQFLNDECNARNLDPFSP
jgi:hypothetical protein